MEADRVLIALENARRVADRMREARLRDRDRRLQQQADEEGCGAVLGDLMARVWQQEDEDVTDDGNPKRDPQIGREVEKHPENAVW